MKTNKHNSKFLVSNLNYICGLSVILGIIFLCFSFIPTYGHGVGAETLPPVMIGKRNATLSIGMSQATAEPANTDREIDIQLYETDTLKPINNVIFLVKAVKDNKILFEHEFPTEKGSLVMLMTKSDSSEVQILGEDDAMKKLFESLFGPSDNTVYIIKGPIFDKGGLYHFQIDVLTADSLENNLEPSIHYNAAISIPERTTHQVDDKNSGSQTVDVITYYDLIDEFNYDSNTKFINFTMPFDWSKENIDQVSIVHEEILVPRTFGDFLATNYEAYVNNILLPDEAISIDDYSSDNRTIHIVLFNQNLQEITKKQKPNQKMDFSLRPNDETKFPIIGFTRNLQYKINLEWDPAKIIAGSNAKFHFKVLDPYLINKTVSSVSYDFSVIQNQKVLFKKSGITTDSETEYNTIDVQIPSGSGGPIIIAFENLGGNSFAGTEFTSVVKKTTSQVFPITLSSFFIQDGLKKSGNYDVDLTWFPSTLQVEEEAEFVFTIKDKNTGIVIPRSSYDFVILQDKEEIFRRSGIAPAGGDFVDYTFSNDQIGSATIRIENINNSGETVEIPIVVTPEFPFGLLLVFTFGFMGLIIFFRLNITRKIF